MVVNYGNQINVQILREITVGVFFELIGLGLNLYLEGNNIK